MTLNHSQRDKCAIIAICALIVLFNSAQTAVACSCAGKQTVLDAFEDADLVVTVRAVSVEKPAKVQEHAPVNGVVSTTVIIEKIFKGTAKVGEKLVFGQGGGADCIWTFREENIGEQYLFYLKSFDNASVWMASTCGRSRPLEYASDDLLFLNNLSKVKGKTRISGTLSFFERSSVEGRESVYRTLPGKKVSIRAKDKTYEVTTDKDGIYEIYDLPPGIYEIQPEVPIGLKVGRFGIYRSYVLDDARAAAEQNASRSTPKPFEVTLLPKRHAYFDFRFEVNSRIRGTVVDTLGNPLDGVCLKLLPAEGKVSASFYKADCTEREGRFQIDDIPAGSYVLVINDDGKIDSGEPFPTFYYPSALERPRATVLTIADGDQIDDLVVRPPRMEETIVVEGVLLYSDGNPVDSGYISFEVEGAGEDDDGAPSTVTDSAGRFRIRILKGLKGQLYGSMYSYAGQFENCPKIEVAIKKAGGDVPELKTNAIAIKAEVHFDGVELKYPFPLCKKKKQVN